VHRSGFLDRGAVSEDLPAPVIPEPTSQPTASSEVEKEVASPSLSIEILSLAIAYHETNNGTNPKSVGYPPQNDVCGLYDSRAGRFMSFPTYEDGLNKCREVLSDHYAGLSIYQIAQSWTGTQKEEWINNVTFFYNKFSQ